MNVIINTEYSSFHVDMTPAEFETVLKILGRTKQVERTYDGGSGVKPVYVLGDNNEPTRLTHQLAIFATIYAPTMPEVEPKAA